ncbi:cilia- and flagella-associated protein 36-like isoform X2 [Dreissena polymorpha]|nr:cilia- and flagella-associated protein 36-like isoform X2 [Dreissena polymorpha]
MKDTKLRHDQIMSALKDMNSKKDLREVFQGLFELVLAIEDYEVFVTMMTQKNIELQQQALMMILKQQGALPESLVEGSATTPPPAPRPNHPQDSEEEIMRRVLEESKREYEEEQKKFKSAVKDKAEMERAVELSKQEFLTLDANRQTEKHKLNQAMAGLTIGAGQAPLIPVPAPAKPLAQKKEQPVIGTPGISQPKIEVTSPIGTTKGATGSQQGAGLSQTVLGPGLLPMTNVPSKVSSSEAAANWLKQAHTETTSVGPGAVEKAAAAMAGMSADEIKKRQEYLRQQRDKLVAMKKKEREKQLLTAEQSDPGRPASARAARQTLQGAKTEEKKPELSEEERKKTEMRRQIANKLKAELMGGN